MVTYPKAITVPVDPVVKGRVQVLTRVTSDDKNDIMRVVNIVGMTQQDVMRMFLMQSIRAFLKANKDYKEPSEHPVADMVRESVEKTEQESPDLAGVFDPEKPPGT